MKCEKTIYIPSLTSLYSEISLKKMGFKNQSALKNILKMKFKNPVRKMVPEHNIRLN
jgi:hypothetical protein